MLITLSMVGESLKDLYSPLKIEQLYPYPLSGVRLFSSTSTAMNSNFLYLYKIGSSAIEVDASLQYLLIGEPDERFKVANYISVPADIIVLTLVEQVNSIFQKYTAWESALLRSVTKDKSIQKLIDLSRDIFDNQIIVYDTSLRLRGVTKVPEWIPENVSQFWTSQSGRMYMGQQIRDTMTRTGFLDLIQKAKGPFICKDYGTTFLVCNININEQRVGFLTIPEINKPLTNLHIELVETLSFCIAQVFERDMFLLKAKGDYEGAFPLDALTGANLSKMYIAYQLNRLGWGYNDKYSVMVIKSYQSETELVENYSHYRYLLMQIFPDCQIVTIKNSIVSTVHEKTFLSLSVDEQDEFRLFLEQKHLKCGCSIEFNDFLKIASYYKQALEALNRCSTGDRYYPVALYADHIADHVMNTFSRYFELEHFIHPAIRTLAKYESDNKGNLLKTLFEYLINDRSYAACTENLYIHKSTLKYRLEKIREIAGSECFDSNIRIDVLLSIKMVSMLKHYHENSNPLKKDIKKQGKTQII